MKRSRLERMFIDRWHEQTQLIEEAAEIMLRCLDWPEKQEEPFHAVTDDMAAWLRDMRQLVENLESDSIELDGMT